jgi:hypothetical protein
MPDRTITRRPFIGVALLGLTGCAGQATLTVRPTRVFFIEPADGAIVTSPVTVRLGTDNLTVRPAGDMTRYTGHHHLLIDRTPIAVGQPIPFDPPGTNIHHHLGGGGAEITVNLPPGPHTLTAQFADGRHIALGGLGAMTATIRVTVVTIG